MKLPASVFRSTCLYILAISGLLVLLGPLTLLAEPAAASPARPKPNGGPKIEPHFGALPLSFEANQGQTAKEVDFISRTPGATIYLTPREAVFVIPEREKRFPGPAKLEPRGIGPVASHARKASVVRMKIDGANGKAKAAGLRKLTGIANYFIGNNPKNWHTKIPTYAKAHYSDIYPGIDLTYYGNPRQMEYDFVVKPGGDAGRIAMHVEGARDVHLDSRGDLVIATTAGVLRQHKPIVYQEIGKKRRRIESSYVLGHNLRIGFRVAAYDPSRNLVIDPILSYSTFLGGSANLVGDDSAYGITVDTSGNAYVTGITGALDFPTLNAFQPTLAGVVDAFVTKINASGDAILYSTYLGGRPNPGNGIGGQDSGYAVAVDSDGSAYITGYTSSFDFPILAAFQPILKGRGDAFVTKLSPSGSALIFSTFFGGSCLGDEYGTGIAVDTSGSAYLFGSTCSTDFPTVNAIQQSFGGESDTFIAKFTPAGTSLVFSTYLGGAGADYTPLSGGLAVDNAGNAYVTGATSSQDFPTVNAIDGVLGGTSDAFVTKIGTSGSAFVYSTYLGGSGDDAGNSISVDPTGNAYAAGATASADFPTLNALQPSLNGPGDAFVTKLNASGDAVVYSTYLGGSGGESEPQIAVDLSGDAYIAGTTTSTDFPTLNPIQGSIHGAEDIFVTKLNAGGSALVYSTYLGGDGVDRDYGIAVDSSGNAYTTGVTTSQDFPTVNAFQPTFGGGVGDAFVAKFSDGFPITSPPDATATVGQPFTYSIEADNEPVGFTAEPLPGGLVLNESTGIISGTPTEAGTFVINLTATGSDGTVATGTLTLTITGGGPTPTPPPLAVTLSMHSVSAAAIENGTTPVGIDEPIKVRPLDTTLKTGQPVVTSGLVADGVTPLLIQIEPSATPSQATTFHIEISISGGNVGGAMDLSNHLNVLQYSGSTQTFVSGSDVVLSSTHPTGFAYVSGIESEALLITSTEHELTATVTVTQVNDPSQKFAFSFKIRRPPIVLVHGFRSDNGAWFDDAPTNQKPNAFVQQLELAVPADFIVPIEYGVNRSTGKPNDDANTFEPFIALAPTLDAQIRGLIESNNAFRVKWAFTRFDAVGHSQGGLLLRMLCTYKDPVPADFYPFRSPANAFRGRFHKIVTLGSPHNGSTLVHYFYDLETIGGSDLFSKLLPILDDLGVLQRKFDPFFDPLGNLDEINGPRWAVDALAKFNLIGTTIYGGKEPAGPLDYLFEPIFYKLTSLWALAPGQNYSRGHVVIPLGSDAIVDRSSQFAGIPGYSHTTLVSGKDISHSGTGVFLFDATFLFGVLSNTDTDTQSSLVGSKVAALLNGPASAFGSFLLIRPDPSLGAQIDAVAGVLTQMGSIQPVGGGKSERQNGSTSSSTGYTFLLAPVLNEEPLGAPFWFVQVFGPSGASNAGVAVTPSASDPNMATVSVDADVVGEVVLHATYATADGKLVLGEPVTVVSRPPGVSMTGIHLVPGSVSLSVGATPRVQVWGDYGNGTEALLYIPPGAPISYTSSDAKIVDVDVAGRLTLESAGTATITLSYLGFSAQTAVTVLALPPPPASVPPPVDAPSITSEPTNSSLYVGESVTLSVTAGGGTPLSYQWQFNGVDIAGATSTNLSLSGLTQAQGGNYSVLVSNAFGATISSPALVTVLQPVQFGNISTRLKVETTDNVLIGGFIVTGTQPKRVIVRAIGPSLSAVGVPGALADPTLELHDSDGLLIATNDNWVSSPNKQAIVDSTVAPANDKESAILMTLNPGAYTAIVSGVSGTTGVGLVEVYDLDQTLDSKLANISTRGLVGTDDNVLIGGFIVLGKDPTNTIVRAIGPSLPLSGTLADPTLELHDGNGAIIASNDNWKDSQQTAIEATKIQPSNDAEAAILATLSPGAYTAIVRGKSDSTGVALVEAYQLDN